MTEKGILIKVEVMLREDIDNERSLAPLGDVWEIDETACKSSIE